MGFKGTVPVQCDSVQARQTWQNSEGLQRGSQDLTKGVCNILRKFLRNTNIHFQSFYASD